MKAASQHAVLSTAAVLLLACQAKSAPHSSAPAPATAAAQSARPAEWGYQGDRGPSTWSGLSPVYAACNGGKLQSPVDLPAGKAERSTAWTVDYTTSALKIAHHEHVTDILDNGHTIQITVDEGSALSTPRGTYALKQFHFHTPSEHTVNGKAFPMEAHFVHQRADGGFAVVAVLFTEGEANENLAALISHFPKAKGDSKHVREVQLDVGAHLPRSNAAHYYTGSFTTPPCTENVEWLVFDTPLTASAEQLQAFASRLHHNNRPIQPSNERPFVTGTVVAGVAQ